ncbi:MAG: transglycosylase SLT domain-containing protein [Acidobacteria bacterium]|jgi:soluble lytic murein transglycosylase|nr:transglycosylase SLT domain-containing protein [Acidobacteriota bacterium]
MLHARLSNFFLFSLLFCITVSAQNSSEAHTKIRNAVENKDYQTAVVELQFLEQSDQKKFMLNNYDYLLARMAEKQGDFAVATANYQAVAGRNSVLSEYALWHLSQVFRASGNLFLERIYLQKLLTLAPESLIVNAANARLTKSYFESKDYDTTIKLVTSGEWRVASERKSQTQNSNQKTEDQKPKTEDREILVLLGQSYLQSGKVNEAREVYTKLINNLPNPAQPDDFALAGAKALDELAVGRDNFGKTVLPLADTEHFRRAQIYQFNRNFPSARLHYQAIVDKHPTSNYVSDALYQTGRGLMQERNFNEAIIWFERVQAEFPDHPIAKDALSQAASAYSRVNKPKEAMSRYQKFIGKYNGEENLERAYLNIVDILRDTGENANALKWTLRTQEVFRGKLPEALALFAQARIHLSQNDWTNALADLNALQNFSDLGGTRVVGGTNKPEISFLKGFVLENMNRYAEAIDVYISIPDGRNEYYGWRSTERLRALANNEQAKFFITQKIGELAKNIEARNAEAQRKAAQSVLRLTETAELRAKMFEILKNAYTTLPDYQKIPNGKILELGRKEVLKEKRGSSLTNHHQTLAGELLFLGLYDEAAPELENSRQQLATGNQDENPKSKIQNPKSDFDYTLAVFYKRGERANRAISHIEPLWKTVPADYEIQLIPREHLELLYPTPYGDSLLKHSLPRAVDSRFVLSVMRQESRYRADVKSNAAARGLMQFISTTADKIADELNRENFKQDELYNPPTAILFGSQYLSNLFKIFPAQPSAVAASYNGGEDNMMRWLARSKSDNPDRYVPEILFTQSKDYVYKVMASYRVYQMLYDERLKAKRL